MGIPDTLDVIVCGGGPAGCAVAGRLAAADPKLQVLLIEAGQNQLNDPWVYRPGMCVTLEILHGERNRNCRRTLTRCCSCTTSASLTICALTRRRRPFTSTCIGLVVLSFARCGRAVLTLRFRHC